MVVFSSGLLVGAWLAAAHFYPIQNVLSDLNGNIEIISGWSSVVLVVVTAIYAGLTWKLVRETKDARQQEIMPAISLELESVIHGAVTPVLKNIGNGPAREVNTELQLLPDGPNEEFNRKSIASNGSSSTLGLQIGSERAEEYSELSVTGTCTDAFGKEYPIEDEICLDTHLSALAGSGDSLNQDPQVRQLENIERHLESIADSVETERLDELVTMSIRRPVLDSLQKHGELTVREIAQRTGIKPLALAAILEWLQEDEVVEYEPTHGSIFKDGNGDTVIKLQ